MIKAIQQGPEYETSSNSVNLLISILVRYPEVITVNFEPVKRVLKFSFMINRPMSSSELSDYQYRLRETVSAYVDLVGEKLATLDLSLTNCAGMAQLDIMRDVASLTREEISLLVQFTKEMFSDSIVRDSQEELPEDELLAQDDTIENTLDGLRESFQEKNLIGFREDGRVLVFHKSKNSRT